MSGSASTTALVVDDHDAFRASARRLLTALGFEVVGEAADGESAIAAVERLRPDVILLDVQLPDIDGFAVTARIVAGHGSADGGAGASVRAGVEGATAYAPAVVLTSSRSRADYGTLVDECGCAGFIAKDDLANGALQELLK